MKPSNSKAKPATIRQVAQLAGASIGTISKVLNGRVQNIEPGLHARILDAIRELRYRPPASDITNEDGHAECITLIIPESTGLYPSLNRYFRDSIIGCLDESASMGWTFTVFTERIWGEIGQVTRHKFDGRCDGIISLAPQKGNELIESLHPRGIPIVQIGSTPWLDRISSVDIDNFGAGVIAANHLKDLGHTHVGFLLGGREYHSGTERWEGILSVFPTARRLRLFTEEVASVDRLVERWKQLGPRRPTAIIGWHDGIVLILRKGFIRAGIQIPEEIALVGVDDSPEAVEANLTSIENPFSDIGRRAYKLLVSEIKDPESAGTQRVLLPPRLIVRDSTLKRN